MGEESEHSSFSGLSALKTQDITDSPLFPCPSLTELGTHARRECLIRLVMDGNAFLQLRNERRQIWEERPLLCGG